MLIFAPSVMGLASYPSESVNTGGITSPNSTKKPDHAPTV